MWSWLFFRTHTKKNRVWGVLGCPAPVSPLSRPCLASVSPLPLTTHFSFFHRILFFFWAQTEISSEMFKTHVFVADQLDEAFRGARPCHICGFFRWQAQRIRSRQLDPDNGLHIIMTACVQAKAFDFRHHAPSICAYVVLACMWSTWPPLRRWGNAWFKNNIKCYTHAIQIVVWKCDTPTHTYRRLQLDAWT